MENFVKVLHLQFYYLTVSDTCKSGEWDEERNAFLNREKRTNKKTKLVSINTNITSNEQKKISFLIFMNLRWINW